MYCSRVDQWSRAILRRVFIRVWGYDAVIQRLGFNILALITNEATAKAAQAHFGYVM